MKSKKAHLKIFFACLGFLTFLFSASAESVQAQIEVDKTVATVGDGLGTPELITYSDLLWELALQEGVSINPPSSDDLNRALQLLIDQRLFALEAKRVPRTEPTTEEVNAEIKRVLARFSSTAEFVNRLNIVGFDSVEDDNFERIMADRVKIEKYLDFRFRAFIVVSNEEERKYFDTIFTQEFRQKYPSLLKPKFEEVQTQINKALIEDRVADEIEKFLDEAKKRAEIVILSEV